MTDIPRNKEEVEFHSYLPYGGPPMVPAVNVKVSFPHNWTELARKVGDDSGGDGAAFSKWFEGWMERNGDDPDPEGSWFSFACESNWEMLQEDVYEIFGPFRYKLYSAGRSGGWAYIENLPDFETWDAIFLGKWRKFCRYARDYTDDIPYSMLSLIYINVYEHEMEVLAKAKEDASKRDGVVRLPA